MRRIAILTVLALPFFLTEVAEAKQPCITNLAPGQSGLTMQHFRSHSAKLGGNSDQLGCAANGKEREAKALKEYLKGLIVIGMPGYNNEKPPFDYMGSLERFVNEHGGKFVPMRTHSDRIIDLDAKKKCGQFRNMAGKRVVLIGHSKGGATALYMWAECPELMNQFEAVILVQAVVQGTAAADIAVNANAATRALAEKIMKYESIATMVGTASGGASMTTEASQNRLKKLQGKVNRGKVVCVRSRASTAELGGRMFDLQETTKVFGNTPNDGLVAFEGQYSSQYCGHDIQLNGVHHKALIERDSVEPSDNDAREAFAAFLLNKVRAMAGRR